MAQNFEKAEIFYLNQLIADLYEEGDKEKALNIFLDKLRGLVFFDKGNIYFYKQQGDNIIFENFIFLGWSNQEVDRYLNKYCAMDDTMSFISSKQPVVFRSSDIFITSEREKSQYYSELLKPTGLLCSLEGNFDLNSDEFVGGISVHRSDLGKDFSQKEIEILKLARPHLSNVAKNFCKPNNEESRFHTTTVPILSNLENLGICIFDFDLNILDSNLESRSFIPPEHIEELINGIKSLYGKSKSNSLTNNIEKDRIKSKISVAEKSYFVDLIVSPIGSKLGITVMVYDFMGIFNNIVFEQCKKHSLTKRELEVLQCMMNGLSNHEIEKKLFISMPTVKSHLTSIYQKMGIEGKYQLFNTILGLK